MQLKSIDTLNKKNRAVLPAFLNLLMGATAIYVWWVVYRFLPTVSSWATYSLLSIEKGSHLGASLAFFFYDTPKVMMLLLSWYLASASSEVFLHLRKPALSFPGKVNLPAIYWLRC